MERITSRANPLIAHVRRLATSAAYRREQGLFLCDGRKLLDEALRCGGGTRIVILTEGSAEIPDIPSAVRTVFIPPDIMRTVSPSRTPQGVLCVCAMPERTPPERLDGRRYLVLDGVQDPGNVGTILRTADAFGGDGVFLLPGCADLYNPKTVRATMGALFRLPAWTCTPERLGTLLKRSALPLYGAALREDAHDVRDMDWTRFAAALGSEGQGLSDEAMSLCTGIVRIPMRARCESLNAAMAAGVILWEAARGDSGYAWE